MVRGTALLYLLLLGECESLELETRGQSGARSCIVGGGSTVHRRGGRY